MKTPVYPTLAGQIVARGISKASMAAALSCSQRTLQNKLNGGSEFTWSEVCTMRKLFFADMELDALMRTNR